MKAKEQIGSLMKLALRTRRFLARISRQISGNLLVKVSKMLYWAGRVASTHGKTLNKENYIWFEGPFAEWGEAEKVSSGYHSEDIFKKVLEATLDVIRGAAAFERDSVRFHSKETSWPLMTAVNLAAKNLRGHIQVLDFGGSLGTMFLQHQEELKDFSPIHWNVVEQEGIVELGNRHIAMEGLSFFPSIRGAAIEKPTLIVLGSVLQYVPDYQSTLEQLLDLRSEVIFLDRHPCRFDGPEKSGVVLVQHVPRRIYAASYPMRVFPEGELESHLLPNYRLVLAHSSSAETIGLSDHLRFRWVSQVWVRRAIN